MKNPGDDKQLAATARTVSNSHELSTDAIKLAAVGISLIKETFPSNQTESEQAAELRLELFAELVEQVGEQRFVRAVRDTIKVSHRRWDCSVARVREMAGLKWTPPATSVAIAWQLVTRVFLDHCRVDADGNYRLEEKVVNVDHWIPMKGTAPSAMLNPVMSHTPREIIVRRRGPHRKEKKTWPNPTRLLVSGAAIRIYLGLRPSA